MPRYFVYCLIDPRSEEIRYIGKTVATLPTRLSQHIYAARNNKWRSHVNSWIKSLLKIGERPMIEALTAVSDKLILGKEEIRLIAYHRKRGVRLTNLTDGGDGAPGRILSSKSIEKMRRSHLGQPGYWAGKKRPVETGRKISASNKGRKVWNKGIPMSEEQRTKVSANRKGKGLGNQNAKGGSGNTTIRSQETRDRISKSLTGKTRSNKVRRKIAKGMRQYRAKLAQRENV